MGVAEARPRLAHLITGLYIQAHIHPLSQQVRLSLRLFAKSVYVFILNMFSQFGL